ncbi:hypothetical protein KP509_04G026000 [Ceratopteris richardii]|uniref:LOB domain-containing protein n=1 Tax=Ceratopteris richardii TaxID=49495 RepID=A0A8T2UXP4_CERRI|nr:hypothetical protein KP509_04G026000 [Ceratopteris richardii]
MRDVRSSGSSPCAACKLLRRRCAPGCIFAPYFPSEEPLMFASVHKVFGASNVNKMLQDLPEHKRGDAVSSMVYEANARLRDPVYGCVGVISALQHQIAQLQTQLALAQAELVRFRVFSSHSDSVRAELQLSDHSIAEYRKTENVSIAEEGLHQSMNALSNSPWTTS